jgi:tRNA A-37 threonylcarbamoyl transferase component Bud32
MPQIPVPGLVLQKKWEDMAKYVYTVVLRHMPRLDRNTLGTEITQAIWCTESKIIQVACRVSGRVPLLQQIDIEAKTILRMIAVGTEMGIISEKKYLLLAEQFVEIGKIVGGLLKR